MSEEEIEELLEIKDWLQKRLSELEEEKEKLSRYVQVLETMTKTPLRETVPVRETAPRQAGLSLNQIKERFGSNLVGLLEFEIQGNRVMIRQKRFLESGVWRSITDIVRELNGRWVSRGEESRWEIDLE